MKKLLLFILIASAMSCRLLPEYRIPVLGIYTGFNCNDTLPKNYILQTDCNGHYIISEVIKARLSHSIWYIIDTNDSVFRKRFHPDHPTYDTIMMGSSGYGSHTVKVFDDSCDAKKFVFKQVIDDRIEEMETAEKNKKLKEERDEKDKIIKNMKPVYDCPEVPLKTN